MNLRTLAIPSTLALTGAALWSYGATRLAAAGDFDYRPNPLGLNMSPYGQVIALAVQGGIDSDWHGVEDVAHVCDACGHEHGDAPQGACAAEKKERAADKTVIGRLEEAVTERTNSRPATPGHKFYLRRQVEDRLRLAYELDPSNYSNYNSYHLFLTEPAVGTRPVLTDKVIQLARTTIDYSLREESDPRPALTAASASANILQLMFLHQENFSIDQMREQLRMLDYTLSKHQVLSSRWTESGDLERLSEMRRLEIQDRLSFTVKVRDAAEKTIERLSRSGPEISSKF